MLKDESTALHTVIKQVGFSRQDTQTELHHHMPHHVPPQDYDPQVPYTLHLVIKTPDGPSQAARTPVAPTPAPTPVVHPQPTLPVTEPLVTTPAAAQHSTSATTYAAQASTSNAAFPPPPHLPPYPTMPGSVDPNLLFATDPSLAAAYTMYSAAFTAYQYATHTAAGNPLPEHLRLASMPFLMVC